MSSKVGERAMHSSDQNFRERIDFLRFSLIVGLVFLHYGSFPGSDYDPFGGFRWAEHSFPTFVSSYFVFFFYSAVPLLSAISGYLFFKDADFSKRFYLGRYRSRVRSILLPMISWNAIALVLSGAVMLLSQGSVRLVAYDIFNLSPMDLANALVGITQRPADFQFWFLHDLFLTILCAPALGVLIRRAPWIGLAGLFALWMANWNLVIFFRPDVLFFFYIGGMARIHNWSVTSPISPRLAIGLMLAYVTVVALRTLAPSVISEDVFAGRILIGLLTRLLRLMGLVALWGVAPFLAETYVGRRIARIGGLAFFLHAIHWPLNQLVKDWLSLVVPGESNLVLLFNFFGTTLLTVLLAILISRLLNAAAPSVFDHLSGGRSGLWSPREAIAVPAGRKVPHGGAG